MEIYGLIGKKLEHSFSPEYFRNKFRELNLESEYLKFELDDIADFPDFIKQQNQLQGLNVTVPYKESIIPFLDELDPVAEAIGAVNTVKIIKNGQEIKLVGYNTDTVGFRMALSPMINGNSNINALILGTGGSSKAVRYTLTQLGINFQVVSRDYRKSGMTYESLNQKILKDHLLIINTTPLGMFPDIKKYPEIPYQFLSEKHKLFDLIYNPAQTAFLKKGNEKEAEIQNGLNMLHFQAEESWRIWQEIV